MVKSLKPFYFLKESITYPGLVLVAIIYYELLQFFFLIIGIEIETATHLSLSFATLSRFSRFLKDAIHCLDIPSRRPRLDKYSQKSTLYQLLDCAKFSYIRHGPAQKVN